MYDWQLKETMTYPCLPLSYGYFMSWTVCFSELTLLLCSALARRKQEVTQEHLTHILII